MSERPKEKEKTKKKKGESNEVSNIIILQSIALWLTPLWPSCRNSSLLALSFRFTSILTGSRDLKSYRDERYMEERWWRPYLSVVWVLSLSAQHSRRAGYCDFLYDDSNTYLFCGYGIWPIIYVKRQKSYSIEPGNIMYKRLSLLIKRRKKKIVFI